MRSPPRPLLVALLAAASFGCVERASPRPAIPPVAVAPPAPPPVAPPSPPLVEPASPPHKPLEPARLHTALALEPDAEIRMGRVTVKVLDPTGEATFQCSAQLHGKNPPSPEQWPCGEAAGWQREPGRYEVVIQMRPSGKATIPDIRREIQIDGYEIAVDAFVWIGATDPPSRTLFVRKFTLDRVREAPSNVTLVRAWKPAPDGSPAYTLRNRSGLTLHGITMWGNFFGHVQVQQAGRWTGYQRGGLCATVQGGAPLSPGDDAGSGEGYFIGGPEFFAPGRYRYVVRVALTQSWGGALAELGDKGLTTYEDRELLELADEFTIP